MLLISPAELRARIARIRFPFKALAAAASTHEDTVGRILNDKNGGRSETLGKLSAAVVSEEINLRDHLIDLHGLPRGDAA